MRVDGLTPGQGPTPTLLFSASDPAQGAMACADERTRANCGATVGATNAAWVWRSAGGMSMRLSTARVAPSMT